MLLKYFPSTFHPNRARRVFALATKWRGRLCLLLQLSSGSVAMDTLSLGQNFGV
jgi:hypothetical protein